MKNLSLYLQKNCGIILILLSAMTFGFWSILCTESSIVDQISAIFYGDEGNNTLLSFFLVAMMISVGLLTISHKISTVRIISATIIYTALYLFGIVVGYRYVAISHKDIYLMIAISSLFLGLFLVWVSKKTQADIIQYQKS